jgi:hypothetical protein
MIFYAVFPDHRRPRRSAWPARKNGIFLAAKERQARGFVGQTFQSAGWAAFQPPVHPRGNAHPNLTDGLQLETRNWKVP